MLNLNFNFNGKTFLRQWWPMVKSLFRQVQTAINGHASNETLDHPDLSVKTAKIDDLAVTNGKIAPGAVTGDKIPDQEIDWNHLKMYAVIEDAIHNGAVTKAKLGADVIGELSDLEAVVSKEYNLSEMPAFGGTDRYTAADIPLNKLVKITNDTDTDLTFFQDHDEYGTALSSPIPARSSRLIVKVKNSAGGAETENGYCLVLGEFSTVAITGNYNDLSNKPDIGNLITGINGLSTVATTGNYNDLSNKPSLHTVATSGDFSDINNVPIGSYNGMGIVKPSDSVNNEYGSLTGLVASTKAVKIAYDTAVAAVTTANTYTDTRIDNLVVGTAKISNGAVTKAKLGADVPAVAKTGNYNDLSNKPDFSRPLHFADLEFTATESERDIDGNVCIGSHGEFLKFDSVLKVVNQADASIHGIVHTPEPNILINFNFTNTIPVGGVGYFYISPSVLTFSEAVMAYTGNGNVSKTIENCSWIVG